MMRFTGFEPLERGPFSVYVGTEFEVLGSWWPGGDKKDEKTVYKVKVTDFSEDRFGKAGKGKSSKVI